MFNLNIKKADQQPLLIVAGGAFIVIIYLVFILLPQVGAVGNNIVKSFRAVRSLSSARVDIIKMPSLKKTADIYDKKIEVYERRLPAEREIPSLLESLSSVARSCSVKIVSITPVPGSVKEQSGRGGQVYHEMPIDITAKSGYHELGNFISKLENADRFMKVTDIRIKTNRSAPNMHDVEMEVSTYISSRE